MAITQRPNGTWQVQLVLGRNPRTGKIERRSWTFATGKEARAFEAQQKQKLEQLHEEHVHPSTQKLEEPRRMDRAEEGRWHQAQDRSTMTRSSGGASLPPLGPAFLL